MPPLSLQLRTYPELNGKTFLIGVGANKCATSWVYGYLHSLAGVTVSPLKELSFFNVRAGTGPAHDTDLLALKRLVYFIRQEGDPAENLRAGQGFQASVDRVKMSYDENGYFDHFARILTPDSKTLCEITPAYSALGREGFEHMKAFFASQNVTLKLFFIMRDPVDRLWSHLRYRDQNTADLDVLEAWPRMVEDAEFMGWSDYRNTVEALDEVFEKDDILYLFYENLFSEPSLKALSAVAGAPFAAPESRDAVNETSLKMDLPDAVLKGLSARLGSQYAFCRQRFGADVPASWREVS